MTTVLDEVVQCWFGGNAPEQMQQPQAKWFRKDPDFDQLLQQRFAGTWQAAMAGQLAMPSAAEPLALLGYIVLTDQLSRNMYRDTAQAFASDALALAAARQLVDAAADQVLPPMARVFAYLPFEHSEQLADQDVSVALFQTLAAYPHSAEFIDYAQRHRDIIRRFGRFPHRNALLGRPSTPEELAFLQQPGSSF
ncbi:DUF924 domain-containing protein [Aquitalea sp. FJL05]|uniref:DUF924 family protein n=1 Tax=Aquitalea sp. FJL05 TaxID=2153366 RepID=UPI000F5A1137|nr:DUF924 family protein [Aquitalea sp. FJL05]RQO77226.1 DUF924 domain-containing protein [Aquitalea sp. FJL05]